MKSGPGGGMNVPPGRDVHIPGRIFLPAALRKEGTAYETVTETISLRI